jgi:hypothetical protein
MILFKNFDMEINKLKQLKEVFNLLQLHIFADRLTLWPHMR